MPLTRAAPLSRRTCAWAIPLLAVGWSGSRPAQALALAPAVSQWRDSRALLGTQIDMVAEGLPAPELARAMDSAFAEIARLSAMMSRYEPGSALSAVNRAAGLGAVPVPAELMQVLQAGQALNRRSDELFDMTVGALKSWHFEPGQTGGMPRPAQLAREQALVGTDGLHLDARASTAYLRRAGMALDLGGVAKLPILAAGLRKLQAQGVQNALINGGGDVFYLGRTQGRPWRVGLRDPRHPSQVLGVLALEGQGLLAASGDYERCFIQDGVRQHHILDPRNGRPSQGPCGVSLLARDVDAVNGMGAVFMIGGKLAGERALAKNQGSRQKGDVEFLVVERDQTLWASPGMRQSLRKG
ncbi:FAD:protein FMN transferase [Roseateles koreensis]|uniref:FAD:protein FMN transferase n=1 Tax=Roseateles koreensis TaxID=2987526 RepID=A0ABT5KU55_9BURK|nr:FAD:protein FMN transferase [Roseateles koreensis]MDC8786449.1 FAD:protein FMN transferase [Roseateles koreensis]